MHLLSNSDVRGRADLAAGRRPMTLNVHAYGLALALAALTLAMAAPACSRGSLPGSPSPIGPVGGGARYNGTLTYSRLSGGFQIDTSARRLDMSVVLGTGDQISGRFEAGETTGTLQGALDGTMSDGRFDGTILVATPASAGGATSTCEGTGRVSGQFSGRSVAWSASDIRYDNCPGLIVASQAQATAVSPVPGAFNGRANVVVTALPSAVVVAGACPGGGAGWPFTVSATENAGVDVRLDSTFIVEERAVGGALIRSTANTPFTTLAGGGRREYQVCAPSAGTYQAFFSGSDSRGNRVRFASPLVTLLP
jgi:hypothetical protein